MTRETVVRCSMPDCRELAEYKVAAPWSDGRFSELKTYGFACHDHLADILRSAEARWLDYEPVKDEKVYDIAVYRFEPGKGDRGLERIDQSSEEGFLP